MHSHLVGSLPGSIPGNGIAGTSSRQIHILLIFAPPAVDKAAGGIASMGALTFSKTHAA